MQGARNAETLVTDSTVATEPRDSVDSAAKAPLPPRVGVLGKIARAARKVAGRLRVPPRKHSLRKNIGASNTSLDKDEVAAIRNPQASTFTLTASESLCGIDVGAKSKMVSNASPNTAVANGVAAAAAKLLSAATLPSSSMASLGSSAVNVLGTDTKKSTTPKSESDASPDDVAGSSATLIDATSIATSQSPGTIQQPQLRILSIEPIFRRRPLPPIPSQPGLPPPSPVSKTMTITSAPLPPRPTPPSPSTKPKRTPLPPRPPTTSPASTGIAIPSDPLPPRPPPPSPALEAMTITFDSLPPRPQHSTPISKEMTITTDSLPPRPQHSTPITKEMEIASVTWAHGDAEKVRTEIAAHADNQANGAIETKRTSYSDCFVEASDSDSPTLSAVSGPVIITSGTFVDEKEEKKESRDVVAPLITPARSAVLVRSPVLRRSKPELTTRKPFLEPMLEEDEEEEEEPEQEHKSEQKETAPADTTTTSTATDINSIFLGLPIDDGPNSLGLIIDAMKSFVRNSNIVEKTDSKDILIEEEDESIDGLANLVNAASVMRGAGRWIQPDPFIVRQSARSEASPLEEVTEKIPATLTIPDTVVHTRIINPSSSIVSHSTSRRGRTTRRTVWRDPRSIIAVNAAWANAIEQPIERTPKESADLDGGDVSPNGGRGHLRFDDHVATKLFDVSSSPRSTADLSTEIKTNLKLSSLDTAEKNDTISEEAVDGPSNEVKVAPEKPHVAYNYGAPATATIITGQDNDVKRARFESAAILTFTALSDQDQTLVLIAAHEQFQEQKQMQALLLPASKQNEMIVPTTVPIRLQEFLNSPAALMAVFRHYEAAEARILEAAAESKSAQSQSQASASASSSASQSGNIYAATQAEPVDTFEVSKLDEDPDAPPQNTLVIARDSGYDSRRSSFTGAIGQAAGWIRAKLQRSGSRSGSRQDLVTDISAGAKSDIAAAKSDIEVAEAPINAPKADPAPKRGVVSWLRRRLVRAAPAAVEAASAAPAPQEPPVPLVPLSSAATFASSSNDVDAIEILPPLEPSPKSRANAALAAASLAAEQQSDKDAMRRTRWRPWWSAGSNKNKKKNKRPRPAYWPPSARPIAELYP